VRKAKAIDRGVHALWSSSRFLRVLSLPPPSFSGVVGLILPAQSFSRCVAWKSRLGRSGCASRSPPLLARIVTGMHPFHVDYRSFSNLCSVILLDGTELRLLRLKNEREKKKDNTKNKQKKNKETVARPAAAGSAAAQRPTRRQRHSGVCARTQTTA
jgi:hypothetical protein